MEPGGWDGASFNGLRTHIDHSGLAPTRSRRPRVWIGQRGLDRYAVA